MTANEDLIFVELALKRDLVTQEQVDEILELQSKLRTMDLEESVADLMLKKGMIEKKEADALRLKASPKGGRQQIEGYKLVGRLGRGGMGSVYKAIQLSMSRPVALKVLKPSLVRNDQQTARLRREAQLVGKLKHPNIVQGLDFGISNAFHYFAMEFVDGDSVKAHLEKEGRFKEKQALKIIKEVAEALDHAHQEGVVHRDIKPGNILLGKNGDVKLADYGLAKGPLEDVELTHSGVTVGTPQYISPEQAQGPSEVDIRTDLYSLGATLYHMVIGRPPYEGETLAHLIQQVLYEPYAPPRSLRRELSADTAFLIEKLMARKPRHRYQTPKDLLRDLEAIEEGRTIVPAGWQGDFEAFHLRRRYKRLFVAVVVLLVLGGAATTFLILELQAAKRKQAEETALALYERLASLEVAPEGLGDRIEKFEEIREEYPGTEGARLAGERIPHLRREQKNAQEANDAKVKASMLARTGKFREALNALNRKERSMPEDDSGVARGVISRVRREIRGKRDNYVVAEWKKIRNDQYGVDPHTALERLNDGLSQLTRDTFPPEESQAPLLEARKLVGHLERAVGRTDQILHEVKTLMVAPGDQDYRKIDEALDRARSEFDSDDDLAETLSQLPEDSQWAGSLTASFERLHTDILENNQAAKREALSRALSLAEQQKFAEGVGLLESLRKRSLDQVSGELSREEQQLGDELERRRRAAEEAWSAFLPRFITTLTRREWKAARTELDKLRQATGTYAEDNRFMGAEGLVDGAAAALATIRDVEDRFIKNVDGADRIDEGFDFGTLVYKPVYRVRVNGREVSFETGTGEIVTRSLKDLEIATVLRESGVDQDDNRVRMSVGIARLGELQATGDFRLKNTELPEVEVLISPARLDPVLKAFTDEVIVLLRTELATAREKVERLERLASDLWTRAQKAFELGQYKNAYDDFRQLLENPQYRHTRFVEELLETIIDFRDRAKRKLPSARMGEYFNAPAKHHEGESVNRGYYRVALSFDMEDPGELLRFGFTEGWIGRAEVETEYIGPPGPGEDPDQPRMVTQHRLRFVEPEGKHWGDWLNDHPLRIESPFLYSRGMSVEFLVRFKRPLALIISLCGTNVLILSDTGVKENGRGVHIWQSAEAGDLANADRLSGIEELRTVNHQRHPERLKGDQAHGRYFGFEPGRWYRVRFVKGEKDARLVVDGRTILEKEIGKYDAKGREIVILTYTPCEIDELVIEGAVDPQWYHRRVK